MLAILYALLMFVADLFKSRSRLEAENLFLRHQLTLALRQKLPRIRLRGSDRALLVWMVQPCTYRSRQSPPRDCEEMSSSFATAAYRLGPYILRPWTGRPHSQASKARHESATHPTVRFPMLMRRINSRSSRPGSLAMFAASNSLATIWLQVTDLQYPYSRQMEWGQVIIFFAVACFAAIVLFMVYRKA